MEMICNEPKLGLRCSNCGTELPQTIADLWLDPKVACTACGFEMTIALDKSELTAVTKSIGDMLHKAFGADPQVYEITKKW